jgi:hypothetical protein
MKISNMDIVDKLNLGETVMFFDLHWDCFVIKNCRLFRSKKNNHYYWGLPRQQFIGKTGKVIFTNMIEMNSDYFKLKVYQLATKTYKEIKSNVITTTCKTS